VARFLLEVMQSEEDVFWLFVSVLEEVLPDYYSYWNMGRGTPTSQGMAAGVCG